jgi:hypothetical protein
VYAIIVAPMRWMSGIVCDAENFVACRTGSTPASALANPVKSELLWERQRRVSRSPGLSCATPATWTPVREPACVQRTAFGKPVERGEDQGGRDRPRRAAPTGGRRHRGRVAVVVVVGVERVLAVDLARCRR